MNLKFLFRFFYKIFILIISQAFSYKKLKSSESKVSSFHIFPTPKLIYKLNFSKGLSCRGVGFNNIDIDPMGKALSIFHYGLSRENKNKFKSILLENTLIERNKNSGYYFKSIGIEKKNNYPLWTQVWPWDEISHDIKNQIYPKAYLLNRQEQLPISLIKELNINISEFPFTELAINLQLEQFVNLYEKINLGKLSKNTFNHHTIPDFFLFVDGDSWRWMAGLEGNHRIYILNLLKYPYITASLRKIIRKNDVDFWPNVKNGFYTRNEALNIFSALFEGKNNLVGLI